MNTNFENQNRYEEIEKKIHAMDKQIIDINEQKRELAQQLTIFNSIRIKKCGIGVYSYIILYNESNLIPLYSVETIGEKFGFRTGSVQDIFDFKLVLINKFKGRLEETEKLWEYSKKYGLHNAVYFENKENAEAALEWIIEHGIMNKLAAGE